MLPVLSDSDLGVIYDGNPDDGAEGSGGTPRILSLLIGGDRAERFNFTPLDKAREEIKSAFDKLWPGLSRSIVDMEFYRYHPRAIAAWPVGRSRFDQMSDEIRTPENNVYLAGDHTESSHSDGAVNSATRAVRQILKAKTTSTTTINDTIKAIINRGRTDHGPRNKKI
jgi:monoamine oxidase